MKRPLSAISLLLFTTVLIGCDSSAPAPAVPGTTVPAATSEADTTKTGKTLKRKLPGISNPGKPTPTDK